MDKKVKKSAIENVRKQCKKAGFSVERLSDDELWSLWWEGALERIKREENG